MKITLLKNLSMDGVDYFAGAEVDVPKDIYDWLVNSYVADRQTERKQLQIAEEKIKKGKK